MRTTTRFFVFLGSVGAVATAVLLPAKPAGAAAEADASISNFSFSPDPVRIPVGTTLKWTNKDSAAHTVTAHDGSWSSQSLTAQATFSRRFDQPGPVTYYCAIHPSMVGTVQVEASTTTAAPTTTTTQTPTTTTAPEVTPTTTEIAGENTTSPSTAGFPSPKATSKPAGSSTTRATAAPTTATTTPGPTTTEPPTTTTAPPPPAAEAALDLAKEGKGSSSGAGALFAAGIAVLLLGAGAAWWTLHRRPA